jgi:hypothetical protein
MNELERLLQSSASQRTRALLRAARSEAPPDDFGRRLRVGVSAAVSVASVASSAAASLTAATGGGGSALSGGQIASSLALATVKWLAVGMMGGAVLAAAAELAFAPATSEAPLAPHQLQGKAAPVAVRDAEGPGSAPVENVPAPKLEAPTSSSSPAPAPVVAGGSARPGHLGRDVAMIDRARRALSASNYAQALSALDEYSRAGTTGALDREARVLRIEALRRSGDVAGAERLTAKYLSEFPSDAHGTRLRSLDAGSTP